MHTRLSLIIHITGALIGQNSSEARLAPGLIVNNSWSVLHYNWAKLSALAVNKCSVHLGHTVNAYWLNLLLTNIQVWGWTGEAMAHPNEGHRRGMCTLGGYFCFSLILNYPVGYALAHTNWGHPQQYFCVSG